MKTFSLFNDRHRHFGWRISNGKICLCTFFFLSIHVLAGILRPTLWQPIENSFPQIRICNGKQIVIYYGLFFFFFVFMQNAAQRLSSSHKKSYFWFRQSKPVIILFFFHYYYILICGLLHNLHLTIGKSLFWFIFFFFLSLFISLLTHAKCNFCNGWSWCTANYRHQITSCVADAAVIWQCNTHDRQQTPLTRHNCCGR